MDKLIHGVYFIEKGFEPALLAAFLNLDDADQWASDQNKLTAHGDKYEVRPVTR